MTQKGLFYDVIEIYKVNILSTKSIYFRQSSLNSPQKDPFFQLFFLVRYGKTRKA